MLPGTQNKLYEESLEKAKDEDERTGIRESTKYL